MGKVRVISTKRLLLRPFSEDFLTDRYVGWLNDQQLMRYSEQRHKTHTIESCRNYMLSFRDGPSCFWAIEVKGHGLGHIGNINAHVDPNNSLADIGVLIGEKSCHGKRYGLEAWVGVCDFLFRERGIRKITGGTLSTNLPMLRLMARVGMAEDGIRRRHYLVDGQEVDIVHMALFKEEWKKLFAFGQFDRLI